MLWEKRDNIELASTRRKITDAHYVSLEYNMFFPKKRKQNYFHEEGSTCIYIYICITFND
jgi:hypothetical protein